MHGRRWRFPLVRRGTCRVARHVQATRGRYRNGTRDESGAHPEVGIHNIVGTGVVICGVQVRMRRESDSRREEQWRDYASPGRE